MHLVGGIVGCLLIGFLGTHTVNSVGLDGVVYGGGFTLLGKQAIGVVSVLAYSFIIAMILGFVLDKTVGFRISRDEELEGIDISEHLESAYDLEPRGGSSLGGGAVATAVRPTVETATTTETETTTETAEVTS